MANEEVKKLESIKAAVEQLQREKENTIMSIKNNFREKVVVFIDMADSTQFKTEHANEPDVWILRLFQFSNIVASAIRGCNGIVVKYIGDEVMGVFEKVNDAKNLIGRIDEIEQNLKKTTGCETRVKITIDYGPVYMMIFDGHVSPDPQGLPVDRCARIAKYNQAGCVLTSESFKKMSEDMAWSDLGEEKLKGIGVERIYQLKGRTIDLQQKESYSSFKEKSSARAKEFLPEYVDRCVKEIAYSLVDSQCCMDNFTLMMSGQGYEVVAAENIEKIVDVYINAANKGLNTQSKLEFLLDKIFENNESLFENNIQRIFSKKTWLKYADSVLCDKIKKLFESTEMISFNENIKEIVLKANKHLFDVMGQDWEEENKSSRVILIYLRCLPSEIKQILADTLFEIFVSSDRKDRFEQKQLANVLFADATINKKECAIKFIRKQIESEFTMDLEFRRNKQHFVNQMMYKYGQSFNILESEINEMYDSAEKKRSFAGPTSEVEA